VEDFIGQSNSNMKDIYGRFASYLYHLKETHGSPGWQTAMNYLSSLASLFKEVLFANQEGIFADKSWYSSVRLTLSKKYGKVVQLMLMF
jgi:hypothetical protein